MRAVLLILVVLVWAPCAAGQLLPFGSLSDPTEVAIDPQRRGAARLATFGGPSYIGVQWRAGAGIEMAGSVGPFGVSVEGRLRAGVDGLFQENVDELHDIIRLLQYARLEPTPLVPLYLRLGPLQRTTLPTGMLVHGFATTAAWAERSVGVEIAGRFRGIQLAGFSSDLIGGELIGGGISVQPWRTPPTPGWRSLRIDADLVHDLSFGGEQSPSAASVRAGLAVWGLADFLLEPFVGHARFLNYGSGTTVGASFGSDDLAGVGHARASLGLVFASDQFIPGYFNAFYPVDRPGAGIVSSDAYFRDRGTDLLVTSPLAEAPAGTSLFFELHASVLDAFELVNYLRRDYAGNNGMFGLRVAISPDRGEQLRFLFDIQRQGLTGFTDLFSDVVDEAILTFRLDYSFAPPFRLFVSSRYGYRRVNDLPDGTARYLVERRFEPMVGIMLLR